MGILVGREYEVGSRRLETYGPHSCEANLTAGLAAANSFTLGHPYQTEYQAWKGGFHERFTTLAGLAETGGILGGMHLLTRFGMQNITNSLIARGIATPGRLFLGSSLLMSIVIPGVMNLYQTLRHGLLNEADSPWTALPGLLAERIDQSAAKHALADD